jgi:hypothetical protein
MGIYRPMAAFVVTFLRLGEAAHRARARLVIPVALAGPGRRLSQGWRTRIAGRRMRTRSARVDGPPRREHGQFARSFSLPENVDGDNVRANSGAIGRRLAVPPAQIVALRGRLSARPLG